MLPYYITVTCLFTIVHHNELHMRKFNSVLTFPAPSSRSGKTGWIQPPSYFGFFFFLGMCASLLTVLSHSTLVQHQMETNIHRGNKLKVSFDTSNAGAAAKKPLLLTFAVFTQTSRISSEVLLRVSVTQRAAARRGIANSKCRGKKKTPGYLCLESLFPRLKKKRCIHESSRIFAHFQIFAFILERPRTINLEKKNNFSVDLQKKTAYFASHGNSSGVLASCRK